MNRLPPEVGWCLLYEECHQLSSQSSAIPEFDLHLSRKHNALLVRPNVNQLRLDLDEIFRCVSVFQPNNHSVKISRFNLFRTSDASCYRQSKEL